MEQDNKKIENETEEKTGNNEIEVKNESSGMIWTVLCGLMTGVSNILMVLFTISAIPMMMKIGIPWYITIGISLLWGVWPYVGLYWLTSVGLLSVSVFSGFMESVFPTYITVSVLQFITNLIMNCYFDTPTWEYRLDQALVLMGHEVPGNHPKQDS